MKFKSVTIHNDSYQVNDGELEFFNDVPTMFDALRENVETGCPDLEEVVACDAKNGIFASEFKDIEGPYLFLTIVDELESVETLKNKLMNTTLFTIGDSERIASLCCKGGEQ